MAGPRFLPRASLKRYLKQGASEAATDYASEALGRLSGWANQVAAPRIYPLAVQHFATFW